MDIEEAVNKSIRHTEVQGGIEYILKKAKEYKSVNRRYITPDYSDEKRVELYRLKKSMVEENFSMLEMLTDYTNYREDFDNAEENYLKAMYELAENPSKETVFNAVVMFKIFLAKGI